MEPDASPMIVAELAWIVPSTAPRSVIRMLEHQTSPSIVPSRTTFPEYLMLPSRTAWRGIISGGVEGFSLIVASMRHSRDGLKDSPEHRWRDPLEAARPEGYPVILVGSASFRG